MHVTDATNFMQRFLSENSPAILTGMGVAGLVTTTALAVYATPIATDKIADVRAYRNDEAFFHHKEPVALTRLDIFKLVWRGYIPAAAFGITTVACIIGANSVNQRRNAALMSVYSLTETAFTDYKAKVIETLGVKKDQLVVDAVAKDRIDRNPVESNEVYLTGLGDVLCYESLSGRYFKCDIETIRKAQNDVNAEAIGSMYVSLNDFYSRIGLEPNSIGEDLGWRSDSLMAISFSSHLTGSGVPCLSLDYQVAPVHGYYKAN